jgi:AGCS family alanine or glycine:cation symporter
VAAPAEVRYVDGYPEDLTAPVVAWHEVAVERLFLDAAHSVPFTGVVTPGREARDAAGATYKALYGEAVESGAPLTKLAFQRGLSPLGRWGGWIVVMSVFLFALSTAISWSYYGDRCANYLFGPRAVLPFKLVFVGMHFMGAVVTLATVWKMGDVALGFVTFPNLVALILLSGVVVRLTKSYFERRPWEENYRVHQRVAAERKASRKGP